MSGSINGLGTTGLPGLTGTGADGSTTGADSSTSGSGSSTGSSGTTGSSQSADGMNISGMDTFLQLLVAQMRNQDPMSPMDDQSFVTELAQFNTVEQMLSLSQTAQSQLATEQSVEGIAMLGRTVTYVVPGVGGAPDTTKQGAVSSVSTAGGSVQLAVGSDTVPIGSVTGVS